MKKFDKKLLVEFSTLSTPSTNTHPLAKAYLKLPTTTYNPRYHAETTERSLAEEIGSKAYLQQSQREKMFSIHEAPLSLHEELHLGHFYNKTLKDIILRYKLLRGYQVQYVYGFECYGPQIEHSALSQNINKKILDFDEKHIRQLSQNYVVSQIKKYLSSFSRWGLLTDWRQSYFTFSNQYVSNVLSVFSNILEKGMIYQDHKPFLWSVRRQAQVDIDQMEVTFHEKPLTIVKLQILNDTDPTFLVAFTSNPWTLTATNIVSINPNYDYEVLMKDGASYIMCKDFQRKHRQYFKDNGYFHFAKIRGSDIQGKVCQNPLIGEQMNLFMDVDLVPSVGTGIQFLCPAHYLDDLSKVPIREVDKQGYVDEDGLLTRGPFQKLDIQGDQANKEVNLHLRGNGYIIDIVDSISAAHYTHRITKEVLILRSTPQLFTHIDEVDLEMYMEKLDSITQNVQSKKNNVYGDFQSIVEAKQFGWCLTSKQTWGIPAPIFLIKNKELFKQLSKQLGLKSQDYQDLFTHKLVVDHCKQLFSAQSQEIWWEYDVEDLLPEQFKSLAKCLAKDNSLVFDHLFVQGCSWITLIDGNADSTSGTEIALRKSNCPCSLVIEGKDSNEGWLFSTSYISMLTLGDPFFSKLITHPLIPSQDQKNLKISKMSGEKINLNDLIYGSIKANETRQYGYGVDALRSLVASITETMDTTYVSLTEEQVRHRIEELNIIRNTYWKLLGSLNDYQFVQNIPLERMSFINRFMYYQLIYYIINVTSAYEVLDFKKVYELYIDFMKSYVLDIYIEGTRNYITSFPNNPQVKETLHLYWKVLQFSLVTISPVLPFNTQNAYKHFQDQNIFQQKWPQIPQKHLELAVENMTIMTHLYQIRKTVEHEIQESNQRLKQKKLRKQATIQIIVDEKNVDLRSVIEAMEDDAPQFFGVHKVEILNENQYLSQKSNVALCSFKYDHKIKDIHIKLKGRVILTKSKKCARCLENNIPYKDKNEICDNCLTYVQKIDQQSQKQLEL